MTVATGDALELALALLRVPAQRQALRERPLPADVGSLLPLAAGSAEALAEAERSSGEPQARILEAARFFLQEVLFFRGADAYRVLGATPGADTAQLRQHHRWLQHWLHPDRRGNDPESIFAGRINEAWNQLRDEQRRKAYDALLQEQADTGAVAVAAPALTMGWRRMEQADDGNTRWRTILPVVALLGACLWLAILLLRQTDAPGDWQNVVQGPDEATPVAPVQAAVDRDTALRALGAALGADARLPAEPQREAGPQASTASVAVRDPVKSRIAQAAAAPLPGSNRSPPATVHTLAATTVAMNGSRPARTAPPDTRVATAPPAATTIAEAMPRRRERANASARATAPMPTPAASTQPAAVVHAGSANAGPAPDPLEQLRQATRRAAQVTHFLSSPSAPPPPVWSDRAAQRHAEDLRRQLFARDGRRKLQLAAPDWRVSRERARLQADYRRSSWRGSGERGVLRMQMVWRDGIWLVDRLDLEPRP